MKTLTLIFCLITFGAFSQASWQEMPNLYSNPNGQRFDDIFFLNENLGWAANGFYAAVYKTTDGGLTWTEQLNNGILGSNHYFRNIQFLDENIGFLGTLNGKFYKTTNGGANWTLVTINPNPNAICGLDTAGTSTIYGCGAYFEPAFIIKSTDSGISWSHIDMSAYANALVEVKFIDELNGFAAGKNANGAVVLKTTDGGTTWSTIYNANIPGEYIWKLQILDADPNIIFGALYSFSPNEGKLIKSVDGGTNWSSFTAPESGIEAVGFISETKGWMGGHTTGFYETNNGGQTWTNLNVGGNLNRIYILNTTVAYAAGSTGYKYTTETLSAENTATDSKKDLDIILIENPVKNNLLIKIDFLASDNLLIELYSNNGKHIKQLVRDQITESSKKAYNFSVKDLPAGTYILDFHNNLGRTTRKFIKK
jgi:photosystem II stability/assembly factor-like uncharacterized protein